MRVCVCKCVFVMQTEGWGMEPITKELQALTLRSRFPARNRSYLQSLLPVEKGKKGYWGADERAVTVRHVGFCSHIRWEYGG